jgi:hypothetical protein
MAALAFLCFLHSTHVRPLLAAVGAFVTGAVAFTAGLFALAHTAFLHHAVETALHLLF